MAYKKNGVKYLDGQYFTYENGELYKMVGTCFQLIKDRKKSISNKHFHKFRHFWLQVGDKVTSPNFTGRVLGFRYSYHGNFEIEIETTDLKTGKIRSYWERYTPEIIFDN